MEKAINKGVFGLSKHTRQGYFRMTFSPRAAVFALAVSAALAVAPASAQQPAFHTPDTFDRALAEARAGRQLILVYVSTRDCVWCRHFERTHLADPAFQAWMRALFQVVRVSGDEPRQLDWLKRNNLPVESVPTYFLLDARGQRIAASKYSAKFPPLKAVQLFDQVKGRDFDFDPGRLTQAARELAAYRHQAPTRELRLAYGAMEALTWHWLRNGQNALAAFGPDVAPELERGPTPGPGSFDDATSPEAWDEIRLWYVGFWSGYAKANLPAAMRVAVAGAQQRNLPQYARWAALVAEQMQRFDLAARYGQAYVEQVRLAKDHPFRQALADWKRRAAAPSPRR